MSDYYRFNFCLEPNDINTGMPTAGEKITFPTAPMYHNKETYSGRNRIWVRHVATSGLDFESIADDLNKMGFLKLRLDTPSVNSFALKMLPDNTAGVVSTDITSDNQNKAEFALDLHSKVDYALMATKGVFGIAGGALANADSVTTAAGNLGTPGRTKVGGGSVVGTHHHYADNFHPANAIEVGNVWGTQMEATLRVFSTQPIREAGGTTYVEGQVFNHLGVVHCEIVVEPLHNQPKQSPFSIEDEKNRQRY